MLEPTVRSVRLMVGRCVLDAVNDETGIQVVQTGLLADEVQQMERMQQYGFTSVPKKGAEGVALFVGGNREHGICIAMDDRRFRLKDLGEGQVALYDESGSKVVLTNDGKVEVFADEVKLGNDAAVESVLRGETFQAAFNAHQHSFVGNLGVAAVTGPPTVASPATDLSGSVKAGN